jgi:hypothetical protein
LPYIPDWEFLGEAVARIMAAGRSESEAQLDICLAVVDRKIEIKYKTENFVTPHGEVQWQPGLGVVIVPDDLRPHDIDWKKSFSNRVWEDGCIPGTGYGYVVSQIKLRTHDVIRILCAGDSGQTMSDESVETGQIRVGKAAPEAPNPSPPTGPRAKSSPALDRAKRAISELYGDRIPQQTDEPNVTLCREVGKRLKATEQHNVSDDTILRAAGRRK